MNIMRVLAVSAACLACAGVSRQDFYPIPERASAASDTRGTESAARAISEADETAIIREVVRTFYRPIGAQARWIDPRPLAHERTIAADSAMAEDEDRATALAQAIGLRRVCALDDTDHECRGRSGGVLRFSAPYAVGRDSAVVYARYAPVQPGVAGVAGEIEFRMVRDDGGWRIASRRSLTWPRAAEFVVARRVLAEGLLAADRAFAAASERTDVISGLSAMFDADVIMPIPGNVFAEGKVRATEALRSNSDNARSSVSWAPIRVGVSADGQHGFTFGYMMMQRPDSSRVPMKYLAYWIQRPEGWRVAALKRRPRPAGEVERTIMEPSLPPRPQAPTSDAAIIARHRESVAAAEKEFSDSAQVMGIGPAFEKFGLPDAVNMGGPNDTSFVVGSVAIGRSVGAGYPPVGSPVSWASDYKTLVASSGDLGITFGFIRSNAPPIAGQPPAAFPFFTIWKRATPTSPWRYIAE